MKRVASIIVMVIGCFSSLSQRPPALSFEGYLETYYLFSNLQPSWYYDASVPLTGPVPPTFERTMPNFMYSYDRHNEVNLNLGLMKVGYREDRVRANLALMAGTYANSNLAHEEGVLRNVFEANVGVQLLPFNNVWLDVGIFESHIGHEGAVGAENLTLTRSLKADNTPYYLSGARLSWVSRSKKIEAELLVLNGWQRIARLPNDQRLAFGHRLTYRKSDRFSITGSSYLGPLETASRTGGSIGYFDFGRTLVQTHYFHDLYVEFALSNALKGILSFDIGMVQDTRNTSLLPRPAKTDRTWYAPALDVQYRVNEKWSLTGRIEYLYDGEGAIAVGYRAVRAPHWPEALEVVNYELIGASLGIDRTISRNAVWRAEARMLENSTPVFFTAEGYTTRMYFFTTSFCVYLRP